MGGELEHWAQLYWLWLLRMAVPALDHAYLSTPVPLPAHLGMKELKSSQKAESLTIAFYPFCLQATLA